MIYTLKDFTNWEEMKNKVIMADCLEAMKLIPDKSIDLILTDPPYGLGIDGQKQSINKNPKHNRKAHEFKGWDGGIPSEEIFQQIFRISKNQIIWGGNYFVKYLNEGHKGWLFWSKGQEGLTMSDGEFAYSSFDVPSRLIKFNRVEILKDGALHPTQKPVELMRWILENYSKPTDLILDPFMGSWTTARACKDLGRNFIGFELEEDYCKVGEERLRQENLF